MSGSGGDYAASFSKAAATEQDRSMNLHEYQGKQLFAEYGLPVSKGMR